MSENIVVTPSTNSILDADSAYNYVPFADAINKAFNDAIGATGFLVDIMPPLKDIFLYRVGTKGLTKIYLNAFPENQRQQHNCTCCFSFIRKYGGLVKVQKDGTLKSVIWDVKVPEAFQPVVDALRTEVERRMILSRVSMYSTDSITTHGYRESGGFNHLYLDAPPMNLKDVDPNAQFETLLNNVKIIHDDANRLKEALFAIECGKVNQPEKFLYTLKFFSDVLEAIPKITNPRQFEHIVRSFEGEAPVGAFHLTKSVVYELLFNGVDAANRYTDGIRYMRPTKDAANDKIQKANELIVSLNLTSAMQRRWAKLDDLRLNWVAPVEEVAKAPEGTGGVFDSLLKANAETEKVFTPVEPNCARMTYARFAEDVLPNVTKLEFAVKTSAKCQIGSFATAVHADAQPLLMHDSLDYRYPVGSFAIHNGSYIQDWGVTKQNFTPVSAIYIDCDGLPMDHPKVKEKDTRATRVTFILGEAKAHKDADQFGLCLFPAVVRRELYHVRDVIEEFSSKGTLQGKDDANAIGVFTGGGPVYEDGSALKLRVTTKTGIRFIEIVELR